MRVFALNLAVTWLGAGAAASATAAPPMSSASLHPKLNPGYHHPDFLGFQAGATHDALLRAARAGTLETLPNWSHAFTINGQTYNYTLLGSDPAAGAATTTINTVLVPIRLTVPDVLVNGKPLVFDARKAMPSVLNSPIFTPAAFDSGTLQFADAMLHAEFQQAPAGWDLVLAPTVAPTLDVVAPAGTVMAYQAKSGAYLGVVEDDSVLDQPIVEAVRNSYTPETYVIFVTYNALYADAFGYHAALFSKGRTAATVFAYNSWLVGVDDLFSIPSPNSDTFAHETAESVHDAISTSITLLWGDWFRNNKCFQKYIEVGDAVEFAPAKVQNYRQQVTINGRKLVYTLQTEAMLPWFMREYPSSAIHAAYSFPGETAVLGPAPFTCRS
jgi:hypothetical protein